MLLKVVTLSSLLVKKLDIFLYSSRIRATSKKLSVVKIVLAFFYLQAFNTRLLLSMGYTKQHFDQLTENYGRYGGWAIWALFHRHYISWGTDQAWVESVWNLLGIESDFETTREKYR
jgi:hypothetical protein